MQAEAWLTGPLSRIKQPIDEGNVGQCLIVALALSDKRLLLTTTDLAKPRGSKEHIFSGPDRFIMITVATRNGVQHVEIEARNSEEGDNLNLTLHIMSGTRALDSRCLTNGRLVYTATELAALLQQANPPDRNDGSIVFELRGYDLGDLNAMVGNDAVITAQRVAA